MKDTGRNTPKTLAAAGGLERQFDTAALPSPSRAIDWKLTAAAFKTGGLSLDAELTAAAWALAGKIRKFPGGRNGRAPAQDVDTACLADGANPEEFGALAAMLMNDELELGAEREDPRARPAPLLS